MTILFLDDWNKYPDAIVNTETTNKSFLRLAGVYSLMGIKNNAFHLSLLQPALVGVDPFDPNLSDELKLLISMECRWNIWYALREIIRLPTQGGPIPTRYIANRGNIAMTWSFLNHIDFSLIQPRQTGKSGSVDALWIAIMMLMATYTTIQLLTNNEKVKKSNIDRLKNIRDLLPEYLNPTTSQDINNKEAMSCLARHNHYKTAVGRSDRIAADNVGRGLTSPILHSDETPYTSNIHISLPVALSSTTAARDNAAIAGGPYGNVYTTTAGKRDSEEGKFTYDLIHNGYHWNEKLLDCRDLAELEETILMNSSSLKPMINGTFSHRQLGKTDAWLMSAIDASKSSEEIANRDYLNIWTNGTESSPLSIPLTTAIHNSEVDPSYIEVSKDRYMLRWYVDGSDIIRVMNTGWHLICLDSSNAVGRDANGIVIQDVRDMSIIAAANISEANLFKFAKWICDLLVRFPKTVFVVENKSSAQGIIDTLISLLPKYGFDPFKRIYNRIIENPEKYEHAYKEIRRPFHTRTEDLYLKNKAAFGFMTTGNSRYFLYDTVLQQAAKTSAHLIKDAVLSGEIRGLVSKNGRVDHSANGHDDICVAWLLGHYFISHSRGLDEYGLDISQVLSRAVEDAATLSVEEADKRARTSKLKLEIENLKQQLKEAKSVSENYKIQCILKNRVSSLEKETGLSINFDSILAEAREAKNKTTRLRDAVKRLNNISGGYQQQTTPR